MKAKISAERSITGFFFRICLVSLVVVMLVIPAAALSASGPGIEVSPIFGESNTTITLSGQGFVAGTPYTVAFGGLYPDFMMALPDNTGEFEISLAVPSQLIAGEYTVVVEQMDIKYECKFEIIDPQLNITPDTVESGNSAIVSGSGLVREKQYKIVVGDRVMGSIITDKKGTFQEKITVPDLYGQFDVLVSAIDEDYSIPLLIISPSISITPQTGKTNQKVTITGRGFKANAPFSVSMAGTLFKGLTEKTDSFGDFKREITVPENLAAGQWEIHVIQDDIQRSSTFVVSEKSFFARLVSSDSIIFVLIGVVLGIIIIGLLVYFLVIKSGFLDDRYSSAQQDLNQKQREFNSLKQELVKSQQELSRYRANAQKLPGLKNEHNKVSQETRMLVPKDKLALLEELEKTALPEEFTAYFERISTLRAIGAYFESEKVSIKKVKDDCLAQVDTIRQDDPELYEQIRRVIQSSDLDALYSETPLFGYLKQTSALTEISPDVKNQLANLEKSVESIRDYSFRLVPIKLIKFANELVRLPGTAKNNRIRELTVIELIKLVNEYLAA